MPTLAPDELDGSFEEPELKPCTMGSPRDDARRQLWEEIQRLEQGLEAQAQKLVQVTQSAATLVSRIHENSPHDPERTRIMVDQVDAQKQASVQEYEAEIARQKKRRSDLLAKYCERGFMRDWTSAGAFPAQQQQMRDTMASPATMAVAVSLTDLGNGDDSPTRPRDGWGEDNGKRGPRKRRLPMTGAPPAGPLSLGYKSVAVQEAAKSAPKPEALPSFVQPLTCHCKKSKCLKLYCECFAGQKMCQDECRCIDCENNEDNADVRADAIRCILSRRPSAFETKILVKAAAADDDDEEADATPAVAHVRGCSCRKSKCLKKYCVCFNTQAVCGEWCKCVGCENGNHASAEFGSKYQAKSEGLTVLAGVAFETF